MASGLLALFDDVAAFAKIASASLDKKPGTVPAFLSGVPRNSPRVFG